MGHNPKKPILFNENSSNNEFISKLLRKKRVGILKNPSILQTRNEQIEDIVSEQIFLLNLSKNESMTRKKTLRNFRKDFFEEFNDFHERKLPNILKKQSSLKEILISSKKLMMNFEQQKLKYKPCIITQFWSDKYYRSLFKHSKLDVLEKDTDKEKIWRLVKQRAQQNMPKDSNFTSFSQSKIIKNEDLLPESSAERSTRTRLEKLPSLHESRKKSLQKLAESDNFPEKMKSFSKMSPEKSRFRALEKTRFLEETNVSLNQIINECDDNKKDFQVLKE